ncbi:response regulator transcription factor [Isosphaeraceae bacterium EP7]
MIRAVVVEDEPLALRYLVSLLGATGLVDVVGEAVDGRAGFTLCQEVRPDAAFLDIQMPVWDGLSVAARLLTLPTAPLVVFVTGFDGHAVDAFGVEAVDYLLKPIDADQVQRAVGRLQHRLAAVKASEEAPRMPIKVAGSDVVRLLTRAEVVAVLRRRRKVWIHTATEELPTPQPISSLAEWLGAPPFLQVARDAIVNMGAVVEIVRRGDRQYRLKLADRPGTVVEASRSGAAKLAPFLKHPS